MEKSLADISLKITEQEYREDKSFHYSTLAGFERSGFNYLLQNNERVETPALIFGSCVDALITGGVEEFTKKFVVGEEIVISNTVKDIITALFTKNYPEHKTFNKVSDEDILLEIRNYGYASKSNWTDQTKIKKIRESGSDYYVFLSKKTDKTVISREVYNDVMNCVQALKTSESTSSYFSPNTKDIEHLYQLKFHATLNGIDYCAMLDEIIVDHANKTIQPIDLKTSSSNEWDFAESFIKWGYAIQAKLYTRVLLANVKADPYFKDFTVLPFKFIVVNKVTLTPLVWEFKACFEKGNYYYGRYRNLIIRDPEEIALDLQYYIDNKPKVPYGIDYKGTNSLDTMLEYI